MVDPVKLDDFVRSNEISLHREKIASNPILTEESEAEGIDHYRCQLIRPGKRLDVYLSVGAEDQLLTLFEVLFMIALDASGCDNIMAGFEKYREVWDGLFGGAGNKRKEIEFFWAEFEGRCRQAERVQEFLGASAHEELLRLFGLEEDRRETL